MNLLTKQQSESYKNAKICYIFKEKFENEYLKYKKAAYVIQSIAYLKKIPLVFHNGSNYDYHFIIKKSAEESKKQLTCLGKNTEKYIIFTFPIEKEVRGIDENGKEVTKNLIYYNLLTAQDLQQAHYQILSKIFLKEFIELNVNSDMTIKNVKLKLNVSIATVFLNT